MDADKVNGRTTEKGMTMFCAHCGKEVPADARFCPSCQAAVDETGTGGAVAPERVKSGLIQAIVVTVVCCVPFGIVAIVYAAQAASLANSGQIAAAKVAAAKANKWSWIAFGVGLVCNSIYIAVQCLPE